MSSRRCSPFPEWAGSMESLLESVNLAESVVAEQYRLRVPSRLEWIEPVVSHLVDRAVACGAVAPGRGGHAMLALHEALTNAIIHGNLEVSSDLKEHGDDAFAQAIAC